MLKLLIIIVLIIVILSLLGVSLTSVTNNQTLRNNLQTTLQWSGVIWDEYLKEPFKKGLEYLFDKTKGSDVKIEAEQS